MASYEAQPNSQPCWYKLTPLRRQRGGKIQKEMAFGRIGHKKSSPMLPYIGDVFNLQLGSCMHHTRAQHGDTRTAARSQHVGD